MAELLSFFNPVKQKAARVVAAGVLVLSIVTLATGACWIAAVISYGFVVHGDTVADVLLDAMIVSAALESILAFCVGCKPFALLMRSSAPLTRWPAAAGAGWR